VRSYVAQKRAFYSLAFRLLDILALAKARAVMNKSVSTSSSYVGFYSVVGDGSGRYSVQAGMLWQRRHPCGELVSAGSVIAMALTPVLERSPGGCPV
jgi:hypothetical protein